MAIKGKVAEGRKKKWKGALECFIPSRIIGYLKIYIYQT